MNIKQKLNHLKSMFNVHLDLQNISNKLTRDNIERVNKRVDRQEKVINHLLKGKEVITVDEKEYFTYKDSAVFKGSTYIGTEGSNVLLVVNNK